MRSSENIRLKKLYNLLEAIRQHKLGLDWESKLEFNELEKKVIDQIEEILQSKKQKNVVK